jgi:hypothetical protein
MKLWRFSPARLADLCPDCEAMVVPLVTVAADGALVIDLDDDGGRPAFKLAAHGCAHPKPAQRPPRALRRSPVPASTLRWLCPYRVNQWKAVRGDERWEVLNGLRAKAKERGWWIDMGEDRVRAFLAEEGDAAKVLLSPCP